MTASAVSGNGERRECVPDDAVLRQHASIEFIAQVQGGYLSAENRADSVVQVSG